MGTSFLGHKLCELLRKVPTSLKINQKLYKSYLKAFDYQNIFTNIEFQNQGWSLKHQLWIRPFSFFFKKILGKSQQKLL